MEWNTFRLPGAVAGFHRPCCGVSQAERRDALGRPDKWGDSRPLVPVASHSHQVGDGYNTTFLSYLHPTLPGLAVEVSRGINDFLHKKFPPDLVSQLDWKDYVYRNIGQILQHSLLTYLRNIFQHEAADTILLTRM